jgi:hypothetical protein
LLLCRCRVVPPPPPPPSLIDALYLRRNDAHMRAFEATQLAVACEEKNKELSLTKLKIDNLQEKLVFLEQHNVSMLLVNNTVPKRG